MSKTRVAPYGSWSSPITANLVAGESLSLFDITVDDDTTTWTEMRPGEDGRYVVVRRFADGSILDAIPEPFSARTRVHEYGGGAYVADGDTLYFSNWDDQRLYRQRSGGEPQAVTPSLDVRYADGVIDRHRDRIICVQEDHRARGEPVNSLVCIPREGDGEPDVLVSGNDFYAWPRLSPDGVRLAWLTWNHPNMPWDGTELWVGDLRKDGSLASRECVAGGPAESIFQPQWSPDGRLTFVSDRTNWWNLYQLREGRVEHLLDRAAEFGRPQWAFRMPTYDFASANRLICSYVQGGIWHLASLDMDTLQLSPFELPYTDIAYVRAAAGRAVFRGGSPTEPQSIVQIDLQTGQAEVLRRSTEILVDEGYLSRPKSIEFPTEHGRVAHGLYYSPRNPRHVGPAAALPPLLVISHGGPTSATTSTLDPHIQYWTSRGIAVLDVNYRGSTGHGRDYRQLLQGDWGIADVEDCVNGARYLVRQQVVDEERLLISGGSAGGYTTLRALTTSDDFAAGASYYGVSDLEALTKETHKFESHYLDRLIGPYPEREDLYRERSPVYQADRITCPVIFLQGTEDKVVPPRQAEMMVDVLRKNGLPVAYLLFEGEQHGFRRAESIERALVAELSFYAQVLGFGLGEQLELIEIEGL
ncbi:MAG: S9 family peptidase [Anaerolineae bacterium]|jgi:dipeptidyl aminopeptidase/acylaminoacyl peptidase